MAIFSESKHGYDKQEVDAFVLKSKYDYEVRLAEQKDRIFSLVEQNKELKKMLDAYTKKNAEISEALIKAVATSREIEEIANVNYQNEIDNLREFHKKWQSYFLRLQKLYPCDENVEQVEKFSEGLDAILENTVESAKEKVSRFNEYLEENELELKTIQPLVEKEEQKQESKHADFIISDYEDEEDSFGNLVLETPYNHELMDKVNAFAQQIKDTNELDSPSKLDMENVVFNAELNNTGFDNSTVDKEIDMDDITTLQTLFSSYTSTNNTVFEKYDDLDVIKTGDRTSVGDFFKFNEQSEKISSDEDEGIMSLSSMKYGEEDIIEEDESIEEEMVDEFNPVDKISLLFGNKPTVEKDNDDKKPVALLDLHEILYPTHDLDLKQLCREFDLID